MKSEGTLFVHEPHVIEESICRRHRWLLNWAAPGRRRNHIHQINCWTLSAFQSESNYEEHKEKETWEGRRTWKRARFITHWSGTWTLFLSYDSEVVWAGGAPGLQLVLQWEASSETQGRISGWQRRHREGAPRHQPQLGGQGMSTGNWGRLTEKTAKSWLGTGCPWVLPGMGWPLSPPVPSLSAACSAGKEEVDDVGLTTFRTTVGIWGLQPAPRRGGNLLISTGEGGGSFWCRTGQIPPYFFFVYLHRWHWENFTLWPRARVQSLSSFCSTETAWNNTTWTNKIIPGWKLFSFSFSLRIEQHKSLWGQKRVIEEKEQVKFWTL